MLSILLLVLIALVNGEIAKKETLGKLKNLEKMEKLGKRRRIAARLACCTSAIMENWKINCF